MEGLLRSAVFVLFSALVSVLASEKVPVLVWTNDQSVVFPQQLAGHSVSHKDFKKNFIKELTSNNQDNVILFMQDKLSVTDFTSFSDVYNDKDSDSFVNVKALMSEMTSTFLPSVALPASALLELKHKTSRKILMVENPRDFSFDPSGGPHLVVVRLPESQHSHKSLSRLDEIIGLITLQMKAFSRPFIAFYTATMPNHAISSLQSRHHGRQLMAETTEASGYFVNVSDSFYFYARNITLTVNGSATDLGEVAVDSMNSECNDTGIDCQIVLMFGTITASEMTIHQPNLTLEFNRTTGINSGFWYLSRFALSYWSTSKSDSTVTVEYSTNFVEQTPFGFSYHCLKMPAVVVKNATGVSKASAPLINFDNFQVQAFVIQDGRFGHYNDCIGFFTIGIWMFLVTAVILLAVLFFGIIMLLNLTTMDRFDDAKGKTITVTATD